MPHANCLTMIGHLGRAFEFRTTSSGAAMAESSVALQNPKKGGDDTPPTWIKLTVWGATGPRAEILGKFQKGEPIWVTGTLSEESWVSKDGEEKKALALNVSNFAFVGSGPPKSQPKSAAKREDGERPW